MRARHPVALAATLAVAAAASAGLAGTSLTTLLSGPGSTHDSPATAGTRATTSAITVQVTDVVDGDTVRVQTGDGRDLGRVRLLGINAPETTHGSEPADCYGDAATELLARLSPPGTTVTLAADPRQSDRDVYGRLLRYVDHQGEDLSATMLAAGAARLYDSEPTLVRASEHQLAAQDAQDDARGLWDAC
ncbi:thermonuclease family protein [Nocardioides sp.]|uniref:thermonuclease family protein n=1 Tax=Nocardioides sp. TaxID=35761 RepID=UPI003D151A58